MPPRSDGGAAIPAGLDRYRDKRRFERTPEPAGTPPGAAAGAAGGGAGAASQPGQAGQVGETGGASRPARRFVVQRHRARRLHYDLRLEIDGVLVSWAVPKGPTLDPALRRAAVHVEDHPIEYLGFEGVIPAGEYGGGDVIVWDTGTWEPHGTDDPAAAVAAGELHADVHGRKLRGRLILVRRGQGGPGREQWLLLHKNDRDAVPGWDPEDHPGSVLSGRTNDQVGARPDRGKPKQDHTEQEGPVYRNPAGPDAGQLAALDALGSGGTWEVFGRRLALTNLDKVLFPAAGGEDPVTKRELIRYAAQIAPVAVRYLAGRALNLHRFPGGAGTRGFWHKQLPDHAPAWLPRWDNPRAGRGEARTYLVADEPAALVWAANFGALEWHCWTSRTDHPDRPTYALIDIDPGSATSWDELVLLARLYKTALDHLGVRGEPKLTGGRGIHIWVPARARDFGETRAWAEQLARAVGAAVPGLVSWKWDVRERAGLARLDYTQNAVNKTLVAPYSPRAAAGAPVSAPVSWEELDDPALRSDSLTIRAMPARLAARGDLFAAVLAGGQDLPPPR